MSSALERPFRLGRNELNMTLFVANSIPAGQVEKQMMVYACREDGKVLVDPCTAGPILRRLVRTGQCMICAAQVIFHDDVIRWRHFPRFRPFVWGIHRWPVNSPHKGQWRGASMFSLICACINGCVNNREAGDLRRHRAHYDVTVMRFLSISLLISEHMAFCNWSMNIWQIKALVIPVTYTLM